MVCKSQAAAYCAYSHVSSMLDRTEIDWWIYMFDYELYWDDSGTHGQSPIAVAACYVAKKSQWDEFVRNWDEAREEEGFDVFHMADFMAKPEYGKKPFCDWDEAKKKRVHFRLANIINTRVRKGFAVAVPKKSFEEFAPDNYLRECAKTHFIHAVKTCMGFVDEWHEKYAKGEPMQYVFDLMGNGKGQIMEAWDMITQEPEAAARGGMVAGGYSFQDKSQFKPLQAADILAWNEHSHMRDVVLKGVPNHSPKPYFAALQRHPLKLGFFTDAQMKENFEKMAAYEKEHGHRAYAVLKRK